MKITAIKSGKLALVISLLSLIFGVIFLNQASVLDHILRSLYFFICFFAILFVVSLFFDE